MYPFINVPSYKCTEILQVSRAGDNIESKAEQYDL